MIAMKTGLDDTLPKGLGFQHVKRYDGIADFRTLSGIVADNQEGFVVKFSGGLRVKIKLAEYVRLHRILTDISNVMIWEYLSAGKPLDELLNRVPDEFYDWVRQTEASLLENYTQIEETCRAAFKDLGDRKSNALYYQT